MPLDINFAIPANIKPVKETSIPDILSPGIITQALVIKSQSSASMILSVDGKKIAPALSDDSGDIDLFGHENPNLQKMKNSHKEEIEILQNLKSALSIDCEEIDDAVLQISNAIANISERIKSLRKTKLSQTFHLEKLIKESTFFPF